MRPLFQSFGQVLLERGKHEAAIAAFERAVKLAPGEAAFRQNLKSIRKR